MDGFKNSAAKTSLFLLVFVSFSFFGVIPQNQPPNNPPKVTKVIIKNADSSDFRKPENPDITILFGNVILSHEGTLMYCDSAYLNSLSNSFEAFDNVRIEQGDTLSMIG